VVALAGKIVARYFLSNFNKVIVVVAGGKIKRLLELAGLKDAWTTAKGSTPTMSSTSKAVLDCLRQTFSQG
jgi:ribosomal protein S5